MHKGGIFGFVFFVFSFPFLLEALSRIGTAFLFSFRTKAEVRILMSNLEFMIMFLRELPVI